METIKAIDERKYITAHHQMGSFFSKRGSGVMDITENNFHLVYYTYC